MKIEQIEAIKLLELIEANLKQLKEFAYNKDYEDNKDVEDLEQEMFNIYWAIEDYMNIKEKIENANEEYDKVPYYFTNDNEFKKSIEMLKEEIRTFSKMDELYEFLKNNLDEDICNISKTKLDRSSMNNYANIIVNVRYPKRKYTSTNCVHISCSDNVVRCSQSDQPMMQKLKCYDYSNRPKEYVDFRNKCNETRKEFTNNKSDYQEILNYCNSCLSEARELVKDLTD